MALSPFILDETAHVLRGRKFKYSAEAVAAVEREMRDMARMVRPVERLRVLKDDPDDDRILECAVASGAEIIVSGDRLNSGPGFSRGQAVHLAGDLTPAKWRPEALTSAAVRRAALGRTFYRSAPTGAYASWIPRRSSGNLRGYRMPG